MAKPKNEEQRLINIGTRAGTWLGWEQAQAALLAHAAELFKRGTRDEQATAMREAARYLDTLKGQKAIDWEKEYPTEKG